MGALKEFWSYFGAATRKKKNNCHKQNKTRISILHLSRKYEKDTLSETEKARGKLHSKNGRAEKEKRTIEAALVKQKEETIVVLKS